MPGFLSENRTENGVTCRSLSFPGCPHNPEISELLSPVLSELIGIPGNAGVKVSVIDRKEVTLSGYAADPNQQNAFFPAKQADVGEPGIWRDIRVVSLRVNPIRYNSATGEVKACTEMTVKLDYSGLSDVNVLEETDRPVKPNYDRMYRALVLNYDDLNLQVEDPVFAASDDDDSYDYLIICADEWLQHMQSFIDWKESLGFRTKMYSKTDVMIARGLPPEDDYLPHHQIMFFLRDEYAVSHFSYLLIVAHPQDITLGYWMFDEKSDYEYSRCAGIDNYPDIGVGRFSVLKVSELKNMINKSIAFQSNPPSGDWLEKNLMIAGFDYATLESSFQDCSIDIMEPTWRIGAPSKTYSVLHPDFITAFGASYEDGGDEATNEDIINNINEGCRFVNYRGHGGPRGWEEWSIDHDRFYVGACKALDNGKKTPAVFAIANGTLKFDAIRLSRNLGEAFTSCRTDGAAAYLGAGTGTEDWIMNPHAGNYYNRHFYKAVFEEGVNAAGDASTYAALATMEYFWDHLCRRFFWLGDPQLQLIYDGDAVASSPVGEDAGKNVPDEMPGKVELGANYPNPFNPSTEISFSLTHACHVKLEIFNIMGQKVSTLVDGNMSAGPHTVTFNGNDQASGMYLYRLQADEFVESKKMLLVK